MTKKRETKPAAGGTKPTAGETKVSAATRKRLWRENGPYRRRCVLQQARGWLEICLRRMEACEASHPNTPEQRHAVSLDEIPDWLAAIDTVLEGWPERAVLTNVRAVGTVREAVIALLRIWVDYKTFADKLGEALGDYCDPLEDNHPFDAAMRLLHVSEDGDWFSHYQSIATVMVYKHGDYERFTDAMISRQIDEFRGNSADDVEIENYFYPGYQDVHEPGGD